MSEKNTVAMLRTYIELPSGGSCCNIDEARMQNQSKYPSIKEERASDAQCLKIGASEGGNSKYLIQNVIIN